MAWPAVHEKRDHRSGLRFNLGSLGREVEAASGTAEYRGDALAIPHAGATTRAQHLANTECVSARETSRRESGNPVPIDLGPLVLDIAGRTREFQST